MESHTYTVQQIFQDRRQYRVPFYQRPYVWSREDQWERLWEDIRDKAESRLQGNSTVPHFMGAVVLEPQKKTGLLGVERHHIIDGQQRLTTLQYVMTALVHTLRSVQQTALVPLVAQCLTNASPETMEDKVVEVFKLWPTFRDRKQYEQAVTANSLDALRERFPESFTLGRTLRKTGIEHPPALEAIWFFQESMFDWVRFSAESDADEATRCQALVAAVLTDLSIVGILLGENDDAQVIFETLNGHGAQLHATDLIRNFIFMRAGTDADVLYNNLWSQFEAPLWSEPQTRGRLSKPRLEWFVQTALQAQSGDEVDIGRLYAGYRRFVSGSSALHKASAQLEMLNLYADHYRELVTGVGDTPVAIFGRRSSAWDASPVHPLAIRVAASSQSPEDQSLIFGCIESYLVRRAICGLSRKNYNKVFSQLLKRLSSGSLDAKSFRESLSSLQGDASRWPSDEEFRKQWVTGPAYPGRLDAAKLRAVFHRLETALRSERTEERVPLTLDALDIDHIMPESWYAHWPLADGSKTGADEAKIAVNAARLSPPTEPIAQMTVEREAAVPRLGNLTLVHYGVNRSLQNQAYAAKRAALFEHSNLQLNRQLMQMASWDETDITARGEALAHVACRVWPGPASEVGVAG